MTTTDLPDLVPVPRALFEGLTQCAAFAVEVIRRAEEGADQVSLLLQVMADRRGLRESRAITPEELADVSFVRQISGIDETTVVRGDTAALQAVLGALSFEDEAESEAKAAE